MGQEEPRPGGALGPLELRRFVPFEPCGASDLLGWAGMEAARYRGAPDSEILLAPLTHHALIAITRPPDELDLLYDGVKRHTPPAAGSILLVPAGSTAQWRWAGPKDSLHIYLEPGLIERVAALAFGLDPARLTVPSLDAQELPFLKAAMGAVDAELTAGGVGGRLAAESLANILAVNLIRHVLSPRRLERGPDGALPRARLHAVLEYIEEHLSASPTLEQIAAVARLSPYHFARQFKAATGLPPHEFVITRRVERAKQLLAECHTRSLAEIAVQAGFSDQSQFSHHFKRQVGVTPRQFRMSARIT